MARTKSTTSKASKVPANETKAERFVRVGTPRVNKAIKAIRQLGKLASSNYEYSEEQSVAMHRALQEAVDDVVSKFRGAAKDESGFTF